ncbi:UNVERIFIED_CONTAM: hypothetical protein Sradi_3258600 [Sesamum radiatum]|uniref:Retrotransposon gag domain-containing protein n=1 Tax=Sesamum radiatum TaxID=300843 RepID=A0AAW2R0S6_SESRA
MRPTKEKPRKKEVQYTKGNSTPHRHSSPADDNRSDPAPWSDGSILAALPPAPLPPRITDPVADPPHQSTSSDTSTVELSSTLPRAIQQVVAAALREHVPVAAPPRVASPPEADAPDEEDEGDIPIHVLPAGRRPNVPLPEPHEVPPQWLARLEHLQKGLQDVKYRIEGAPENERQGVPFTETFMADELSLNCRTPAIAEYNGTMDPMEHLSRFKNATLLHRYTDGIKCRVFVTTFAEAAQQWFNQLPVGVIGSFQKFRSLFLHQFASSRKVRKMELSLFAIRQGEDEPLKEHLQRCNTAAFEVPAATQKVKANAFSKGSWMATSSSPWPRNRSPSSTPSWLEQRNTLIWRKLKLPRRIAGERSARKSERKHRPRNPAVTSGRENPLSRG